MSCGMHYVWFRTKSPDPTKSHGPWQRLQRAYHSAQAATAAAGQRAALSGARVEYMVCHEGEHPNQM